MDLGYPEILDAWFRVLVVLLIFYQNRNRKLFTYPIHSNYDCVSEVPHEVD